MRRGQSQTRRLVSFLLFFIILFLGCNYLLAFTVKKDPLYEDEFDIEAKDYLFKEAVLECQYESGFDQLLQGSKPLIKRRNLELFLVFKDIDLSGGKAILLESNGEYPVSCTQSGEAIMFTKKEENGAIKLMSVYGRYEYGTQSYLSIISEHGFTRFGGPKFRGYHGICN